MESGCEGCATSYVYGKEIRCMLEVVSNFSTMGRCPCRTCIVKGMCFKDCEKFSRFLARSAGEKRYKKNEKRM
jgi:hypothetical protein